MKDAHYIAIAKIQEAGGLAAIIDLGKTIDVEQGKKFGVNFDELLVSQPDTLQVGLVTVGTLIQSGEVEWIGIDYTNWKYDLDKEGDALATMLDDIGFPQYKAELKEENK